MVLQLHSYQQDKQHSDTTRLQPVVLQLHSYQQKQAESVVRVVLSDEVEVSPAEAWWCRKGAEKVAV